jgi:hypothetical protein
MLPVKNLLISIAGVLNLMPGFLILQKSEFIPPYSSNVVFAVLSSFVATICFLLVLFSKNRIKSFAPKRIVAITIFTASVFIISLVIYSFMLTSKIKRDGFGTSILPITNTQAVKDIINQYGSIDAFLAKYDTVSLNEHLKDPESGASIKYCEALFIFLYIILNAFLIISISIIGVRISTDKKLAKKS